MDTALKNRTLSAAIADRLRQEILGGVHGAGVQLRQDALAKAYGVSRIPVREALFQLEGEGLVQMVPHKGAVVTGLSPDEVRDVFDLRTLLEVRLLAQSIPALTEDDLAALDALQKTFSDAIARHDRPQWGMLNAQLHLLMYRRAPLPRTMAIVAALLQTSERYTRLQLVTKSAWERAEREHNELIELCRARNAPAACDLLKRHIAIVRSDLEALIAPRKR
ncbi:MAG: transcriptional [Beijerinckiaceae bacterium]|nr:MAG: transcriptional [Beijerinckiaceae bacterium]